MNNKEYGKAYLIDIRRAIGEELEDAKRMLHAITFDPRRKLDQPNEKLHYWDGKVTGLTIAFNAIDAQINRMQ